MPFQEGIFKTFSFLWSGFITGEQGSSHLSTLLGIKRKTVPPRQPEEALEVATSKPDEQERSLSIVVSQFFRD